MTKNNYLPDSADTLFLMLTYACNLHCTYCLVHQKKEWMNYDVARKSINVFFKYFPKARSIRIFGGEPLLNFTLLKDIITYAKVKARYCKKNIVFDVTTNGTLLSDDHVLFFKENTDIELIVSIDGSKRTQLRERIGHDNGNAYDWIDAHKNAVAHLSNSTVNKVVSPGNVGTLVRDFISLYSAGFRRFNILPAYFNRWEDDKIRKLKIKFRQLSAVIYRMLESDKKVYIKNIDVVSDAPLFNKSFFVDANGDIYPSNIVITRMFKDAKGALKMGHIDDFGNAQLNGEVQFRDIFSANIPPHLLQSTVRVDHELSLFVDGIKKFFK